MYINWKKDCFYCELFNFFCGKREEEFKIQVKILKGEFTL